VVLVVVAEIKNPVVTEHLHKVTMVELAVLLIMVEAVVEAVVVRLEEIQLAHTQVPQVVKVVLDCSLHSQVQIQHMLAVAEVVEHQVVVQVLFTV
jgi:hypothetical protein